MGTFDDANVDKDLLSQIFADEGDDAETDALLDEMLKDVEREASRRSGEETPAAVQEEPAAEEPAADTEPAAEEPAAQEEPAEQVPAEEPQPEKEEAPTTMPAFETNTENDPILKEAKQIMDEERKGGTITTITAGTTIKGGISSDGSLEVMGVITGDVECQGKVAIVGTVTGNVIASEIYVSSKRLEGGLSSEGTVKIGVGTIIIGDVDATSAYIAGAVKGDIDVNGHVIVDSTAIVQGNIKAKSIQVNNGAVVDGYCSLNYAGVNLEDFFAGTNVN
ncbi:polymer-forming cytoskeletal protein [bacterium D16-51]|nr:polymer-forming cytoskeletal protein [bacterium D16-59]RKI61609.1 polymer-forming cytoskeletal protein [bacterium D16-51]